MKYQTLRVLHPLASRSITVVIPCLNEEGNLEKLFWDLQLTFDNLGFTLPVLLVDDGSVDQTPQILVSLQKKYSFLRVIRHPQRRGVAAVWRTAIINTNTDWIFWGQADLESDFKTDLPALLEACGPDVDGVAGWRQKRGDNKLQTSKFANGSCRLAFGMKIHDMNWIKLVRRDLLTSLPIEKITHRFLLAVLAGQGYNITEVPTPWHNRYSGVSKFGRKRLLKSAIDFSRVFWWFYIENPVVRLNQYTSGLVKASKFGIGDSQVVSQTDSNT
ncbi:glycosyltransferase family 2 protein [Moorena sp. SIO3H5]|uniref:glycosyltransferase family 2 protein n=1 Tax=Moorena sp. SIO3H5 TaxID=2607834 RepID=UPI0013BC7962|nr:glycosyltransferase family 2 protein [Moorena sp. SIO3H5]NEO72379.1 glycosyltransferase family 2 protein [Moorena sp. SIO3H5]